MANGVVLLAGVLLFMFGITGVITGFGNWLQARLIQDTPTETVAAAAAGRTELTGVGRTLDAPAERLLADERCLVSRYEIERWDDSDDGEWDTVARGTVWAPFQVDDGTGTMRVEPDGDTNFVLNDDHHERRTVGAYETEPDHLAAYLRAHTGQNVSHTDGVLVTEERRYTEEWIPVGAELYLLGATEPVEPSETNSSGLVLRHDEASDTLIVAEMGESELVDMGKTHDAPLLFGGLVASAAGLYVVLDSLGLVVGGVLALVSLGYLLHGAWAG